MNGSDRILKWIEPEANPRNTIYGTIAAGLVVAAEDPAAETYPRVVIAAVVAVAAYWLAHGYAHSVDERLRRGDDGNDAASLRQLGAALAHEWPLIEGAATPLIALLVAWAAGVPLATGVSAAVGTAAAALVAFELAGGLRRRLKPLRLLANASIGLALGGALFGVKMLLH